jgi:hypothetical protein
VASDGARTLPASDAACGHGRLRWQQRRAAPAMEARIANPSSMNSASRSRYAICRPAPANGTRSSIAYSPASHPHRRSAATAGLFCGKILEHPPGMLPKCAHLRHGSAAASSTNAQHPSPSGAGNGATMHPSRRSKDMPPASRQDVTSPSDRTARRAERNTILPKPNKCCDAPGRLAVPKKVQIMQKQRSAAAAPIAGIIRSADAPTRSAR